MLTALDRAGYHPQPMPRLLAVAAAVLLLLELPTTSSARRDASGRLAVFAAASLTEVFPAINSRPNYSFAGSDQLAFQIQQGARADVFAAASPKYPDALSRQGLVRKPIAFATNSLVLIVPRSNPADILRVDDLTKPGVKIVIGDPAVPVGSYTARDCPAGIGPAQGRLRSRRREGCAAPARGVPFRSRADRAHRPEPARQVRLRPQACLAANELDPRRAEQRLAVDHEVAGAGCR